MSATRKTPAEIIEFNKQFITENNLKTWDEIHVKVLELRRAHKSIKLICLNCGTINADPDQIICLTCNE